MSFVESLIALAIVGAGGALAWWGRHAADLITSVGGQRSGGRSFVVRDGIEIDLLLARRTKYEDHEVGARVRVHSPLRLAILRNWRRDRALPILEEQAWALPVFRDGKYMIRTDAADAAALDTRLEASLTTLAARVPQLAVACDGRRVIARIDGEIDRELLAAAIEAVFVLASWDDGLTDTLRALDGATPLRAHELDPGVALAPDALVIGVRDGEQTVARLDGVPTGEVTDAARALLARAGDPALETTARGARLAWAGVERDPARLRAGVAALRALAKAGGPYR